MPILGRNMLDGAYMGLSSSRLQVQSLLLCSGNVAYS